MSVIKVDCMNRSCPIPLVETRKAVNKASAGDIIEITGNHEASKKEIPMAVKSMGHELLSVQDQKDGWRIEIKIRGGENG
jgi:tRNA 2-thiouridine synthesizing protein A